MNRCQLLCGGFGNSWVEDGLSSDQSGALTFDGHSLRLYSNSKLVGSVEANGQFNDVRLSMGSETADVTLRDLRVYGRALGVEEIQQVLNGKE